MRAVRHLSGRFLGIVAGLVLTWGSLSVQAQDLVSFPAASGGSVSASDTAEAVFTRVDSIGMAGKQPAVVLLHSAWGWSDEHEGFSDYATALQKAGFATLELRMFPTHGSAKAGGPAAYLPELFGALNFLSSQPEIDAKRIGVAGYSRAIA